MRTDEIPLGHRPSSIVVAGSRQGPGGSDRRSAPATPRRPIRGAPRPAAVPVPTPQAVGALPGLHDPCQVWETACGQQKWTCGSWLTIGSASWPAPRPSSPSSTTDDASAAGGGVGAANSLAMMSRTQIHHLAGRPPAQSRSENICNRADRRLPAAHDSTVDPQPESKTPTGASAARHLSTAVCSRLQRRSCKMSSRTGPRLSSRVCSANQ